MPAVFDTSRRPWIDPGVAESDDAADLLRAVVTRCPSGALHIEEHSEPGASHE